MKLSLLSLVGVAAVSAMYVQAGSESFATYEEPKNWLEGVSLGLGYHFGSDNEGNSGAADLQAVQFKASKEIVEWLDVELQYLIGTNDDTVNVSGVNATAEIDNSIAAYLKPNVDIELFGLDWNWYGLLGYAQSRLEASIPGASAKDTVDGLSTGLGFSTPAFAGLDAGVEYVMYPENTDYTGFNFALSKKF